MKKLSPSDIRYIFNILLKSVYWHFSKRNDNVIPNIKKRKKPWDYHEEKQKEFSNNTNRIDIIKDIIKENSNLSIEEPSFHRLNKPEPSFIIWHNTHPSPIIPPRCNISTCIHIQLKSSNQKLIEEFVSKLVNILGTKVTSKAGLSELEGIFSIVIDQAFSVYSFNQIITRLGITIVNPSPLSKYV